MTCTAPALPRVCPGCGARLRSQNPGPYCDPCQRKQDREPLPEPPVVDLEKLIAGLLLVHGALQPDEPLHIIAELQRRGIEVDCWAVGLAVRHLERRHGIIARGVKGRPGYALVSWERRYRPATGFGGTVMDRDTVTGRYRKEDRPMAGAT